MKIAFVARPDGQSDVFLYDLVNAEVRNLTRSEGSCRDPSWSPDGQEIVFQGQDSRGYNVLMKVDVEGGSTTQLTVRNLEHSPSQPSWSPDGTQVVFHTRMFDGFSLAILRLESNDVVPIGEGYVGLSEPGWSPDGSQVIAADEAYFDDEPEGRLYSIDPVVGGATRVIAKDPGGMRSPSFVFGGEAVLYQALRRSVNRLFIQELSVGVPREIGPVTFGRTGPSLSPDGSTLAFAGYGREQEGIWICNLSEVSSVVAPRTWGTVKMHVLPPR